MKRQWVVAVATLVTGAVAAPGALLDSAAAVWKFDAADTGSVSLGQVVDSTTNGHDAASLTYPGLLNWTNSVPAAGPGGADAVDVYGANGRGLHFDPVIVATGSPSTVQSGGATVANFNVSGSATYVMRFFWEGLASPDAGYSWVYNNGHASSNGWLVGLNGSGRIGQFQYQNGDFRSPATFVVPTNTWCDFAVVLRDNDEEGGGVDYMDFYLFTDGGSLLTASITGAVNGASAANTIIGSESLGQGTGNQRKGFTGTLDYIAVWDSALSDSDVRSLIIPEPGTAMLLGVSVFAFFLRRRH